MLYSGVAIICVSKMLSNLNWQDNGDDAVGPKDDASDVDHDYQPKING